MNACPDIIPLLLEAEPDELRGVGASRVAEHVRSCRACAHVAGVLLDETAALDAYLGGPIDPHLVEAVLARADTAPDGGSGVAPSASAPRARRKLRPGWRALAAAAAASGLLLLTRDRMPEQQSPLPLRTPSAPPIVRAAPDQNVAVFQTDDPDITVLWFF